MRGTIAGAEGTRRLDARTTATAEEERLMLLEAVAAVDALYAPLALMGAVEKYVATLAMMAKARPAA